MSVLLPKPATMQQGELLLGKDVLNKKQLCVKYGCKFDVPILHGLKLCTLVCLQLIPLSLSHESYQFIDLKKYDNFRKVSYFSTTHQFILGSAILCWVESPVHCVHKATLPHVCFPYTMLQSLSTSPSHTPTTVPSLPCSHFPLLYTLPFLPNYSSSSCVLPVPHWAAITSLPD